MAEPTASDAVRPEPEAEPRLSEPVVQTPERQGLERQPAGPLSRLTVFLLGLEALTGLVLLFHVRPVAELAYGDLVDLREASGFGFVHELHHWGSQALILAVWLHLLWTFATGAYRPPRQHSWTVQVLLLVLVVLLATTGALLPWDQTGYWAIATRQPASDLPAELGDAELGIFYALHCGLLPVAVGALAVYHWRRSRRDAHRSR